MTTIDNRAVVERRREPPDSLDFFPTPPWATRALLEGLKSDFRSMSVWEPAAGEGHMAEVLGEYSPNVRASDVHDYGRGYEVGSFVSEGADVAPTLGGADWVITNPPFARAEEFLERALSVARIGVALLMRSNWIDGQGRHERVFSTRPPGTMAQFSERVPMVKGRWDPDATTATPYAWFIWPAGGSLVLGAGQQWIRADTVLRWIPPGRRQALTKPDDRARFAAWSIPSATLEGL